MIDLQEKNGIDKRIKGKVDEMLKLGLKNYKIRTHLEDELNVPEELLPTNAQLSDRRFYLKQEILKDLKDKTLGGFKNWVEKHSKVFSQADSHDFYIINSVLLDNDFKLLFTTKALLLNAVNQDKMLGIQYLAVDATHKLVSSDFKFSTFATITLDHQIADIAYMLHLNEDSQSYNYGLKEIKNILQKNFKFKWNPMVIFFFEANMIS